MIYLRLLALSIIFIAESINAGMLSSFTRSLPRFATTARTHFFNTKILTPTTLLGGVFNKKESPKNPIAEEMERAAKSRGFGCFVSPDLTCNSGTEEWGRNRIRAHLALFEELKNNDIPEDIALCYAGSVHSEVTTGFFVSPQEAPYTYTVISQISQKMGVKTSPIIFAYDPNGGTAAQPGYIQIAYSDIKDLSSSEATAILAHEKAHQFLKHAEKILPILANSKTSPEQYWALHHTHELEADQKAAEIMDSATTVISALKKVQSCAAPDQQLSDIEMTEIEKYHAHPCPETRIKKLQEWQAARDTQKQKNAESKS